MRTVSLAILAISPALLHAQAPSPAQPVLQARVSAASSLLAKSAPGSSAPGAATSPIRISTGVVAPRLLQSIALSALPGLHDNVLADDAKLVVEMTIDANGTPVNPTIAQSANPALDRQVLAAVSRYRYLPGTLDGQPFALPIRLTVTVQRGAQY